MVLKTEKYVKMTLRRIKSLETVEAPGGLWFFRRWEENVDRYVYYIFVICTDLQSAVSFLKTVDVDYLNSINMTLPITDYFW